MPTIPTQEPKSFRAGDTIQWTRTLADYLPADWDLKYKIVGNAAAPVEVTATEDGDTFAVEITAAQSADLAEGIYTLIGWVENSDDERHTVYEDKVTITADLAAAAGATDTRSHYERTLALLESAIERHSTNPIESIVINGKQITRPTLDRLYALRSKYAKLVRNQRPKRIVASFPGVR